MRKRGEDKDLCDGKSEAKINPRKKAQIVKLKQPCLLIKKGTNGEKRL